MSWVGLRLTNDANAYPFNNAFPSALALLRPTAMMMTRPIPQWPRHLHLTRASSTTRSNPGRKVWDVIVGISNGMASADSLYSPAFLVYHNGSLEPGAPDTNNAQWCPAGGAAAGTAGISPAAMVQQ